MAMVILDLRLWQSWLDGYFSIRDKWWLAVFALLLSTQSGSSSGSACGG